MREQIEQLRRERDAALRALKHAQTFAAAQQRRAERAEAKLGMRIGPPTGYEPGASASDAY